MFQEDSRKRNIDVALLASYGSCLHPSGCWCQGWSMMESQCFVEPKKTVYGCCLKKIAAMKKITGRISVSTTIYVFRVSLRIHQLLSGPPSFPMGQKFSLLLNFLSTHQHFLMWIPKRSFLFSPPSMLIAIFNKNC